MGGERKLDPESLGDHVDRLYRAACALCGSRADAEDLVQETFARVLRKPRFLRAEDDIGYLLRALRNTFASQRRAAAARPATTPLPDDLDRFPTEQTADATVDRISLYGAISALPAAERDALIAVDLVGMSYGEAARALGARETTITMRLHRARQRLARSLEAGEPGQAPASRATR